jgi:competence protein ComEC
MDDLFWCNSNVGFYCLYRKEDKCKHHFEYVFKYHASSNCSKIIGTLLLGDIKLDYKGKKQKELFTHFKNFLPSTRWIQLSHHGANNGWNEDLIKSISGNSIYLASYGEKNKYHHPHKRVVMKLAENNRKFISVTEENEYNYEFYFDN